MTYHLISAFDATRPGATGQVHYGTFRQVNFGPTLTPNALIVATAAAGMVRRCGGEVVRIVVEQDASAQA